MSEAEDDIDDEIVAKVSDFIDGLLKGAERDDVANKIESDPVWKQTHADIVENRKFMSGMQKARAPARFTKDVTSTIHKRSKGRFFGLGDRVPFNALLIVAIIAMAAVGYLMWASQTGSLKVEKKPPAPTAPPPKPPVSM